VVFALLHLPFATHCPEQCSEFADCKFWLRNFCFERTFDSFVSTELPITELIYYDWIVVLVVGS